MRRMQGTFLFFVLSFFFVTSSTGTDEPASLSLQLPTGWRIASNPNPPGKDRSIVTYLKAGETLKNPSEMIVSDTMTKSKFKTAKKVAAAGAKELKADRCRMTKASPDSAAKRITSIYECPIQNRSGAIVTLEGDNALIYSVKYEVPRGHLIAEEKDRLTTFLNESVKICTRTGTPTCVR
jgi:hypothetical protein